MTMPRATLIGLGLLGLTHAAAHAAGPAHPLDPLSADELERGRAILDEAGYVTPDTRFPTFTLHEPDKADVRGWSTGEPIERRAFAVLKQGPATHEALVDLDAGEVTDYREVPGVQPNILLEEWEGALNATVADPRWQEAMRKRGYESFDTLFCAPLSTGWFGEDDEPYGDARTLKVPCFDTAGAENHLWGRPIEGLYAVVDSNLGRVIDVVDNGIVPVPEEAPRYGAGDLPDGREALKPVEIVSPEGANFTRDGHLVDWQGWRFHVRMDRRVGPVLSTVSFDDAGERRDVLYQMTMAEMFVPYMDPDDGWYFRSYMDIGEYGFGLLASQLRPGTDCPEDAEYLNATIADDMGAPFEAERVMCVFERNTGSPGWRHAELIDGTYEGRPEVELVVRTIPTVGNYDYVVDYVFKQRGQIETMVGATGIDASKGVETTRMDQPTAERDTRHGELAAPNVVAVYHDHYISFRIDLDVDGTDNTFVHGKIEASAPESGARGSIWTLNETERTEEGAIHGHGPDVWAVVNPNVETALGHHPGYQIEPGHGAVSVLDPSDRAQARAAFSSAPLWLTTYESDELYAAGDYPNRSRGGEGLPEFVDGDATVNEDLVVWYTVGFHHVTRTEDWPVLPTKWHNFLLRPYNFFERNPALDVPAEFATTADAG